MGILRVPVRTFAQNVLTKTDSQPNEVEFSKRFCKETVRIAIAHGEVLRLQ